MSIPPRGRLLFSSLVLVGLALTGCAGGQGPLAAGTSSTASESAASTPSSSPSASASSSPSSKPLCPENVESPPSGDDCTVYTQDQRHADNTRYREQMPVTDEVQARLDGYVGPVREALEALAAPPSVESVVGAFAATGWDRDRVQNRLVDGTGVVVFGAGTEGGCVVGYVEKDGTVTVSAGGHIYDGGCMAASGH